MLAGWQAISASPNEVSVSGVGMGFGMPHMYHIRRQSHFYCTVQMQDRSENRKVEGGYVYSP